MSIYTQRLGSLRVSGAAWFELYRAPSTGTTVIRHVTIANISTAAIAEAALRMRPLTKAGEVWLWYSKAMPIGSIAFDLRQVLAPGEALEAFASTGTMDVAVTGYVFNN